jgi:outer membrane biosynthesis protein TonB
LLAACASRQAAAPPPAASAAPPTVEPNARPDAAPTAPPFVQLPLTSPYWRQIQRTMVRHAGEVKACYEAAVALKPGLHGMINLRFTIAADGSVTESALDMSRVNSAEVEDCIVDVVRHLNFPPPEDGKPVVNVVYPIMLGSK